MKKILSICIPSYNMEKYLSRCLDSLMINSLDKLETIVVNDGSKDDTLRIANKYKEKYPNSIVVIDKPNGHYGSTINAALKVATGKYFRILDADDWFDKEALEMFVSKAETIEVDCIFTRFTTVNENNENINVLDYNGVVYDKILDLDSYVLPKVCFAMHSLTYSLDMLKKMSYCQTEGVCYTDTEYVFYPLRYSKNIFCLDLSLYQYFLGRDDQSMALKNIFKNLSHFEKILNRMLPCCDYKSCNTNVKNIQDNYILSLMNQISLITILGPGNSGLDALKKRIDLIKQISKDLYKTILSIKYGSIPYVKIWNNFGKLGLLILLPLKIRVSRHYK
ncbi:MAG: glycosyltransferase family 2 protein [Bacteroidales bacterium]|nr:glycosyltransferase family 2 protein [Bacteroidales bacterium]